MYILTTIGNLRFITEPRDIVTTAGKTTQLDCKVNYNGVDTSPQYRWKVPEGQYLDLIGDTRR